MRLLGLFVMFLMYFNSVDAQKLEQMKIDSLMDRWHHAAATADEDVFFGFMTDNCIYLGTDPGERWLRDSLRKWSEPYFERESAWAFEATTRNMVFSENENYVWFDELLDTWMGVCRGSGVLKKIEGEWKMVFYNLSITVKNEDTKALIKLIEERDKERIEGENEE